MIAYLIVPAWSDQAGQCRIVARQYVGEPYSHLEHYRAFPNLWRDAGRMSSRGKLVCLSDAKHFADMRSCEPLAAGTIFTYEENT